MDKGVTTLEYRSLSEAASLLCARMQILGRAQSIPGIGEDF